MRPIAVNLLLVVPLLACAGSVPGVREPGEATARAGSAGVDWQPWSAETFERARRERKLILVSVQAGWCHWCHVMNRVTFRDAEVLRLLSERFVVIRIDSDARPDLAERYIRWGWPATALLTPHARPITEMRGYRPPERFAELLARLVRDLDSGRPIARRETADVGPDPELEDLDTLRALVRRQLDGTYDTEAHGWGMRQKYPFAAPVEQALFRAGVEDDALWRERALETLERHARLIDPVWGGMYQYSLRGRWDRPHYEKITQVQAGALHNFAQAYRATGDARWLVHARAIYGYAVDWLWDPEGGFYASQDADVGTHGDHPPMTGETFYALSDAERRRAGAPHVDRNVYANLNGMMLRALVELYEATLDAEDEQDTPEAGAAHPGGVRAAGAGGPRMSSEVLERAITTADRILRTHTVRGGFAHAPGGDAEVMHLADQVEMARGLLALHEATAQPRYQEAAESAMGLVLAEMRSPDGGLYASTEDPQAHGVFAERRTPLHHGAVGARVLLALHRLSHDGEQYRAAAVDALRALARVDLIRPEGRKVGEYLLALEELRAPYAILSVVGPADDPATDALHRAALRFHHPTRLVELGRPGDSRYPYPGAPAVYLCTASACSMPIEDPSQLQHAARRFLAR